jgi:lambda repressor-like predicted transcriptional regulator
VARPGRCEVSLDDFRNQLEAMNAKLESLTLEKDSTGLEELAIDARDVALTISNALWQPWAKAEAFEISDQLVKVAWDAWDARDNVKYGVKA